MTASKPKKPKPPPKPGRNGVRPKPRKPRVPPEPVPPTPPEPVPPVPPVPTPSQVDPPEYAPANSRAGNGRLASEVEERCPRWLIPDLVAYDTLTFVVGDQGRGKSTMGAWLCSQAQRPCILPGAEESVEVLLISRLRANLVDLSGCRLLDDRPWTLPSDRAALTGRLRDHQCDLLWIDPVDTYIGSEGQNDEAGVRSGLEALVRIATDLHCAIVCSRHPGKQTGNWCPGTRAWRTVPKVVLVLTQDDGPPLRRFLRAWKPGYGVGVQPREYTLLGDPGEPRRFSLGQEVDPDDADVIATYDPVERTMLEQATALISAVLANGRMDSQVVRAHAEREGIKDGILRRAARRLGYKVEREGTGTDHKSYWSLLH